MPSPPPFVIGVTGHMDLPEGDLEEQWDRWRFLFRWLRADPESLLETPAWWATTMGKGGVKEPLAGLGLGDQPLVLLTSLAPGIDTLAAKVALAEGIEVRAPLPFPAAVYPDSTTFSSALDPEDARKEFGTLMEATGEEEIHDFPVVTVELLEKAEGEQLTQFREDLEDKWARNRRYRAAGEFVGTHSHLLFAFFHPDNPNDASSAGSQTILDVTRTGPTAGILPGATHFPWNDAVPVVYVPCRSLKRLAGEPGSPEREAAIASESWKEESGRFLPPLWNEACAFVDEIPTEKEIALCEAKGISTLRRSIQLLRDYGAGLEKEKNEVKTLDPDAAVVKLLARKENPETFLAKFSEKGRAFLKLLSPLAVEHARGSQLSSLLTKRRRSMMRRLGLFTFLAAFSFHGFSHWYFAEKANGQYPEGWQAPPKLVIGKASESDSKAAPSETSEEAESQKDSKYDGKKKSPEAILEKNFGFVCLILTAVFIGIAGFLWRGYRRTTCETLRFDARALSEGLRVQFYWLASGHIHSVAQRYMSRQKGELDWIRNSISAMSFPYERWREHYRQLTESDRRALFQAISDEWVRGQSDFYAVRGKDHEHRLHRHHYAGWALTWAGILQVAFLFVWKYVEPVESFPFLPTAAVMVAAFFLILLWRRVTRGKAHAKGTFFGKVLDQAIAAKFFPLALAFSAVLLLAVYFLPEAAFWVADTKELWVILTGTALVSGAIIIAWGEKLLLAEQSRQYLSMHELFRNAESYLTQRFEEWDGKKKLDEYAAGTPEEAIQLTLEELGKEALDEQAEWLVLHRARPMEPFLAG
ncbi:MAG: hypothetical protein AAF733_11425 [Verrucomicrobiota bacterium]